MKKTNLLFISILFISCSRKITTELSNKMIELKSVNGIPNNFSNLNELINNKDLILWLSKEWIFFKWNILMDEVH
jgi:erythromycin esterase